MRSILEIVAHIIDRDLRGFIRELEAFPTGESIWAMPAGIANSSGTLALHCAGNVQHYIGARLGNSDYVRDRDREFSARMVPTAGLIGGLEAARKSVETTLLKRHSTPLPEVFPDLLNGQRVPTDVFLMHLSAHLAYHLGQVDYHRRITTGLSTTADTISIRELPFTLPGQVST